VRTKANQNQGYDLTNPLSIVHALVVMTPSVLNCHNMAVSVGKRFTYDRHILVSLFVYTMIVFFFAAASLLLHAS
jgi:hypothetical protein